LAESGVIVIDKVSGPTSHDIVQRVRKKLDTREVGHAGTLDPMATGVLVVAIGEGTKLVSYLTASDKSYVATIALGVATDTLDATGKETERKDVPLDLDLTAALEIERVRTKQIPPAFSAIHTGGERAHEKARRGEDVDLEPRDVSVKSLTGKLDANCIHVEITVSKGYYVRSLARDLAASLGTLGHLTMLRRTQSGTFTFADACTIETLKVIPLVDAAKRVLPFVTLSEKSVADARNGRLVTDLKCASGLYVWLDTDGALVAIGKVEDGVGRVVRGFR
jgi:tRNA pseudouridine55 synthase